jgi:diketogulonate reductase-like aldo/keto reductase
LFIGDNDSVNLLSYSEIFVQLLLKKFIRYEQIGFDKQNAALEGTLMLLMTAAIDLSLTHSPPYY